MEARLEDISNSSCVLCGSVAQLFFNDDKANKSYLKCQNCEAVFLARENRLSFAVEKARYDLHENDPEDDAYKEFLFQLVRPFLKRLLNINSRNNLKGLDYGSGPNPTLSIMLNEHGLEVDNYDPIYGPKLQGDKIYDFITCTEAAEHFYNPAYEFEKISSMLKPGGLFGLMTLFLTSSEDFRAWYYRRDPSHVIFYSAKTLNFIANKYFSRSGNLSTYPPRVAIFKKN